MSAQAILIAVTASNAVALLVLLCCWRWPTVGRTLYALMFFWAGPWNLYTVWGEPQVYLNYAQWVVFDVYRSMILGPFAQHIPLYVSAIAIGQIAIAVLVGGSGRAAQLGLAGAMMFLAAITPFGIGSGFPFTLITIWAAILLWRSPHPVSLPALLWRRLRRVP